MIRPTAQTTPVTETGHPFGGLIHFYPRTSDKYLVLNLEPSGILSLHTLAMTTGPANPLELAANIVPPSYEWLLQRSTKWPSYHFTSGREQEELQHSSLQMGEKPAGKLRPDSEHSVWLSNIETVTCTKPHTPFWMVQDLFPLQAYTGKIAEEAKENLNDPLFQDTIYKQTECVSINPSTLAGVELNTNFIKDIIHREEFSWEREKAAEQEKEILGVGGAGVGLGGAGGVLLRRSSAAKANNNNIGVVVVPNLVEHPLLAAPLAPAPQPRDLAHVHPALQPAQPRDPAHVHPALQPAHVQAFPPAVPAAFVAPEQGGAPQVPHGGAVGGGRVVPRLDEPVDMTISMMIRDTLEKP